jgi:hypothetical protein
MTNERTDLNGLLQQSRLLTIHGRLVTAGTVLLIDCQLYISWEQRIRLLKRISVVGRESALQLPSYPRMLICWRDFSSSMKPTESMMWSGIGLKDRKMPSGETLLVWL